jgi:hypothetical protein
MIDERKSMPSASSFHRYVKCPGAFQLEQQAREIGQLAFQSSADALRGEKIHAWLAGEPAELSSEEQETANNLKDRSEEQIRLVFQDAPYTRLKEKRVWLFPDSSKRINLSARFDDCCYNSEVALVTNFKTGWKEPEPAKINSQCRVETLLVAVNLKRIGVTPKRFIAQINTMPFGVMQAEFSYEELAKMYLDITSTLLAIENPDALLNPSIENCDHCPAILVCNAVKSLSVKLNPIDTNPGALSHNLDKIKVMQKHMEEFEAFVVRGLTSDPPTLSIRDWEMVPGVERRDWKNMELAQQRMVNEGIAEHKLKTLKTHTPAAYEKIYAAHYGQKPDDIRDAFNALMSDCIEIRCNRPSLKKVKDVPKVKAVP